MRRGAGWRPAGGPVLPLDARVDAISCTAAACLAVGSTPTTPLAYRWTS